MTMMLQLIFAWRTIAYPKGPPCKHVVRYAALLHGPCHGCGALYGTNGPIAIDDTVVRFVNT